MKNRQNRGRGHAAIPTGPNDCHIPLELLANLPGVLCSLDKTGKFLYTSESVHTHWGYTPAALQQKTLQDIVLEEDWPAIRQLLHTAIHRRLPADGHYQVQCLDGMLLLYHWSLCWNSEKEILHAMAQRENTSAVVAVNSDTSHKQSENTRPRINLVWWEWTVQGEAVAESEELFRFFEFSDRSLRFTTASYLSQIHSVDLALVQENLLACRESPTVFYRHRVIKSSGEVAWLSVVLQQEVDEKGNLTGIFGTARSVAADNSEGEMEVVLQKANERLRQVLDNMSDGFYVVDRSWIVTFATDRVAAMVGLRKEDYIGQNLWEKFPEGMKTKFYSEFSRAFAENNFVFFEEYYEPFNMWFEVNAYPVNGQLSIFIRDITRRKQQERELKISDDRFHLLAKATSDAVWDWDMQTDFVEWCEGYSTNFGYQFPSVKVTISNTWQFIHPDDVERVKSSLNKALKGNAENWLEEYRVRRADDSYAYVANRSYIIRNESGRAVRLLGAVHDITLQKQQEKRLEFIAKATAEVIWERNMDEDEVLINADKFRMVFGHEIAGGMLTRTFWLQHIHPDDLQKIHENKAQAIKNGFDFYLNEYRFKKANGQWAYVRDRTYIIRDFDALSVSFLGAMEDVTPQVLYEKALLESEESYRQLFDNGPLPTIIFDGGSFDILDVNSIAVEQYGYTREEFLSKSIFNFLRKEEHTRVVRQLNCLEFGRRKHFSSMIHRKKNGQQVLVEISATRIFYKGTDAVLATANDVTEKVRLQKLIVAEKISHQKSITKAAIEAQERERSEIGKELHDNVNQLLAAAKLYVESIRHLPAQQELFIEQSISLLTRSINENRRLSHALVTPALRDTGLRDTLEDLIETFEELQTFSIHAVFDVEESRVNSGLALTIYRILQENFSNTVKYAHASQVHLLVKLDKNYLHVYYRDNGIGFNPSAVKKGIGLRNIVNRAEAYRGKVKIKSSVGSGYELKIVFPVECDDGTLS